MSCLNPKVSGDFVVFDREECGTKGRDLHKQFVNAHPFQNIVIDDFLPESILRRVLVEFPSREPGRFANPQSNLKTGYQLEKIQSVFISNLLYALNSAQFLTFMEFVSGIEGLIPDPYYTGGGLHETARGGHLSIHADFNINEGLRLIRRLNLIVFLNDQWREEYGGQLEFWDREMTAAQRKVVPVMGRAVIFNTDQAYHGHADPLNTPEGVYRRSMALYYYTAPTRALDTYKQHTTQFRVRPGSKDFKDYSTIVREKLHDLCPPLLWRIMVRK